MHCVRDGAEPLRVMIHAGKQWDDSAIGWPATAPDPYETDINGNGTTRGVMGMVDGAYQFQPFGAVVAVATITGQRQADSKGFSHYEENPTLSHVSEWLPMARSTWEINKPYMWHWELADVRPLPEPVPAKGRQGLWIPDAELVEAVEVQL